MNLKTLLFFIFFCNVAFSQKIHFTVEMQNPEKHEYQVQLSYKDTPSTYVDFSLPAWSPGYYQLMNFGKNVTTFKALNDKGQELRWIKFGENTWRIFSFYSDQITVNYTVKSDVNFIAAGYLNEDRAFIKPAAVFLYPNNKLKTPVSLTLKPHSSWTNVATGLTAKSKWEFTAPDFDILYDSPLLVGNLKELPSFTIKNKKHRFLGYKMGEFNETRLMNDLENIIKVSTAIFDDIPYEHYTFIGIGPGNGGIEQLNSTAIAFDGTALEGPGRIRTLSFLAHEYFHHFNAKRIRPIELGPFDYSGPNRTNGLWVAEGLTAYYENIILNRAGLTKREDLLKSWSGNISRFQKNEGRLKQSLAESSAKTWEDGPFGKKGETISYYEKGPFIGLFLDIKIRTATNNKKSLDDVMRYLYNEYYKKQNRGFTDEEMQKTCENIAGQKLTDVFEYLYSVKELDYKHYLSLIGIDVSDNYDLSVKPNLSPLQKNILDDLFRE